MPQRLTDKHKTILYRIAIRQDEQGRQPSNIRMVELESSEIYRDLCDLEFLSYMKMGEGEKAIASLVVTIKGLRYCSENLDELSKLDKQGWASAGLR